MDEALTIADKICIMKDGKIEQYDTPENILRNPENKFIKDFIGSERVWNNPEYIKARDIMITYPVCVKLTRTVLQGIQVMRNKKVDSLLVTDKDNSLHGIVTIKDMKYNPNESTLIEKIMTREVLTANEDDNLEYHLWSTNCK